MKNKNLFLVVLETSKSKNEGPTASEEGLLAASSHSVREPKREREREREIHPAILLSGAHSHNNHTTSVITALIPT
jgi:hypothetical protein